MYCRPWFKEEKKIHLDGIYWYEELNLFTCELLYRCRFQIGRMVDAERWSYFTKIEILHAKFDIEWQIKSNKEIDEHENIVGFVKSQD